MDAWFARLPRAVSRLGVELWALVIFTLGLALIVGHEFLPGQDLPNHAAITDLVLRLLRGESGVGQYYSLRLFDFTYRLLYLCTVPLAAVFGAVTALRLVLIALWAGYLGACRGLLRSLALPGWGLLLLAPWFFGFQMFAGFLPSLLAVVLLLWSLRAVVAALDTASVGPLAGAAALGVAVGSAHVVLSILWAASIVAYVWVAGRSRWRRAAIALGVGILPAALWMAERLVTQEAGASNVLVPVYKHPFRFMGMAFLANIDPPLGTITRAVLILIIIALIGVLAWRVRRCPAVRGALPKGVILLAIVLGAWMVCFLVMPSRTRGTWGLNLRFVEPMLVLGGLLAVYVAHGLARRARLVVLGLLILTVVADGTALKWGFARATRALADLETLCSAMPRNATLRVVHAFHDTGDTGWSLAYHAHGYCMIDRLAYDDGVFPDRHMPFVHTPPASILSSPEGQVGGFDFLLLDTAGNTAPPPQDGELVEAASSWRLYRRASGVTVPADNP